MWKGVFKEKEAAMNYFLEKHENLSIDELISSLKNSLDNHNMAAILALCFIIPDLLSKNMGNNKKENYIKCLMII